MNTPDRATKTELEILAAFRRIVLRLDRLPKKNKDEIINAIDDATMALEREGGDGAQ